MIRWISCPYLARSFSHLHRRTALSWRNFCLVGLLDSHCQWKSVVSTPLSSVTSLCFRSFMILDHLASHKLDVRRFHDDLGVFVHNCGQWNSSYENVLCSNKFWLPPYELVIVLLVTLLYFCLSSVSCHSHRFDVM